jgi:uncharacterized membrane protein
MKTIITLAIILIGHYSFGQLKFSNQTNNSIYLAIHYIENSQWKTSGWYEITSGQTSTIRNQITNRYYYYYAHTKNWDKVWSSNDAEAWVHETDAFETTEQEKYSVKNGYKLNGFKKIDVGDKSNFTVELKQRFIFIGDNKYEASDEINFPCENMMGYSKVLLTFTKTKDKGSNVIFESGFSPVIGTVLFYLDNDKIIKLYDKGRRDSSNGKDYSIYYLTYEEVKSIINSNINAIRYTTGTPGFNDGTTVIIYNKSCLRNYGKEIVERIHFDRILSDLIN